MKFTESTLTDMWHRACDEMIFAKGDSGKIFKGSSMTISYGHLISAKSMAYEMDVWKNLHLTKSRFPTLQRTYLDLDIYEQFVKRCHNSVKERGSVTQMPSVDHGPRGINRTKKTGNYAHGKCILGWTFRMTKDTKKPVLGMHSRVSYITYMGALDLALCYCMAKEIGSQIGFDVEDFEFEWYCNAFQIAHMQSVSYFWSRKDLRAAIKDEEKWPDDEYPTVKLMRKTLNEFKRKRNEGFAPEQEKFAQLMRYRRRWEARVNKEPWPDIPVDTLTLDAMRRARPVKEEE